MSTASLVFYRKHSGNTRLHKSPGTSAAGSTAIPILGYLRGIWWEVSGPIAKFISTLITIG